VEWPDLTDPAIGFAGVLFFQLVLMMNVCEPVLQPERDRSG
jgi:hypothetical protein